MRKFFFKKLVTVFISVCVLLIAVNAKAVDVDPSKLEITVVEGKQTAASLELTNRTHDIIAISVSTGKYRFMLSKNSTPPSGKKPSDVLKSCQSWIVPDLKEIMINPGESKKISFTINVPQGIQGEYASCILFDQSASVKNDTLLDNDAKKKLMDFEVNLIYRRSIPIYLFIKDSVEIKGLINSVKIEDMLTEDLILQNAKNTKNQIKFSIDFQNTGTKHIRAKGSILILDGKGSIIDTISAGKTLPIFPGFNEKIPVFCEAPAKPGAYNAIITLDLGDEIILQSEKNFSVDEKGFLIK
ncbi:hypothetical protein J7L67_07205 [bacterium]|nr:hypothetical protein [bacterium]